jgi:hypothetical protein
MPGGENAVMGMILEETGEGRPGKCAKLARGLPGKCAILNQVYNAGMIHYSMLGFLADWV